MKFYRVNTGYRNNDVSALDVILYEEDELGNVVLYPSIDRNTLQSVKGSEIIWYTKTKRDALRYGDEGNIDTYEYQEGEYTIVGEDGDGGYLVVVKKATGI